MLIRNGLLILILSIAISVQAQSYGLLQHDLSNPQQQQINAIAESLEEGLGRGLTVEEFSELNQAISEADLENPNLVRVSKRDRTSYNFLFCLWGAVSPIVGSVGAGTCADLSGNNYRIIMTTLGPGVGIVGRFSVLYYEGIASLPVEGSYKSGVISEAAISLVGAHFGAFENRVGSQKIVFFGGTSSFIFAFGWSGSINDIYLGLEITRLKK